MLVRDTSSGVSNACSLPETVNSKTKKLLELSKLQDLNILSSSQTHCNLLHNFPPKLEATLSSHQVKYQQDQEAFTCKALNSLFCPNFGN